MASAFAFIVNTVFCKLNRKTMVWAFMQSGNKTLYFLSGPKFKASEVSGFLSVDRKGHAIINLGLKIEKLKDILLRIELLNIVNDNNKTGQRYFGMDRK